MRDVSPVIVTFLSAGNIDLSVRGIGEAQAADLRGRLTTFAEEWDSPEMDIYDYYDDHILRRATSFGRVTETAVLSPE